MKMDYVARARALVGTRFRAQGRGPEGLDCVGVVLGVFAIPAQGLRTDYALRGDNLDELRGELRRQFRQISKSQLRPGDVMLLQAGEGQPHLGIRTAEGFVHAHAGIRRVVETPGLPELPLIGIYRKRSR
jgi:cell wall-associated NlpC family hydrolase